MGNMSVPEGLLIGSDFADYMHSSEEKAKVIPAANYREDLKRALFSPEQASPGLPWGKTLEHIQFREGEVSMWAGTNGSGKSMLTSHVILGLLRQEQRCCIASFEMKPVRQLQRMARQVGQGARPTEQVVDEMCDWLLGKLWLYDQQGTVRPDMVFRVCRYAAEKLGCKHVVIDSLMKCVRGEDDYNGQKDFVDEITSIARDTGLHIHLVHHVRKPDGAEHVPSKFDAKGSGSISDQVDNVFMVWRNKPKEAVVEREARGDLLSAREQSLLDAPDALLACEKQRNGDWEGRISLWFHPPSLQYCADDKRRTMELMA